MVKDYFKQVLIGETPYSLTVCSYHVTYAFKSESKLFSCLNVKELFPQTGATSEV